MYPRVQVPLPLPGWLFLPERLDQRGGRDDPARGQGKQREQRQQAALPDWHRRAAGEYLHRTEKCDHGPIAIGRSWLHCRSISLGKSGE